MKKLLLYFFILGSILSLWCCTQNPSQPPAALPIGVPGTDVTSIVDFVLQGKIQGAKADSLNPTFLQEMQQLQQMGLAVNETFMTSDSAQNYSIHPLSCCGCGTGCCKGCGINLYVGPPTVLGISVKSDSTASSFNFKVTDHGSFRSFETTTPVPNGRYTLNMQTSLPVTSISIPIDVKGTEWSLPR
jgi:hypothetical protein